MSYGPPPNQGWQQPPPGWGQPVMGPRKPPLPGIVVTLGILAIVYGLLVGIAQGFSGGIIAFALRVVTAILALVGGIMLMNRARAGAILLTVSGGLGTLLFALSFFRVPFVGRPPGFNQWFDLLEDGLPLLQGLFAVAVLVLSLLPVVTKAAEQSGPPGPPPPGPPGPPAFGPPGPPPPGYGPPPPGYGPPPQQPPPPNWRQ